MEKKLYTGTVCKINFSDTNYRAVVQEDELNCVIVRINKVPSKILENLINNDDCNVILLELDDGKYLSVFNAYVQRGTFGMRLDDGSLMDNNSEIVLVPTSAIECN